jgi:hypothetical protein
MSAPSPGPFPDGGHRRRILPVLVERIKNRQIVAICCEYPSGAISGCQIGTPCPNHMLPCGPKSNPSLHLPQVQPRRKAGLPLIRVRWGAWQALESLCPFSRQRSEGLLAAESWERRQEALAQGAQAACTSGRKTPRLHLCRVQTGRLSCAEPISPAA